MKATEKQHMQTVLQTSDYKSGTLSKEDFNRTYNINVTDSTSLFRIKDGIVEHSPLYGSIKRFLKI